MQKITSLVKSLEHNPRLQPVTFIQDTTFRWDHTTNTVYYDAVDPAAAEYLMHEAGHALLGHSDYKEDVTLLAMERAAWDEAVALGKSIKQPIDEDIIEEALDSYRDWLHARSTCPKCSSIGIQTVSQQYTCLACHAKWKVNEARSCALRRYAL